MTHPTYQRVVNEHMQPDEVCSQMTNGKAVNNNGNMRQRISKELQ